MTDDRFEREVRAALQAREPGPVPAALRQRVAAIPATASTGRLPGVGELARGFVRVAAVTAALALLVSIADFGLDSSRVEPGTVPDPGIELVPFVDDGAGLFSDAAAAEADRRLEAVFRATGLEVTLVTQRESAENQLSTPPGFPERYDRDGDDGRDLVEVVGIDPGGTVACCLSVSGPAVVMAEEAGVRPPQARLSMLLALFADPAAVERDAALDQYVRGIELMGSRLSVVAEAERSRDALRTGVLGGVLGVLAVVAWLLRRRSRTMRLAVVGTGVAGAIDTAVIEELGPSGSGGSGPRVAPIDWGIGREQRSVRDGSWRVDLLLGGVAAIALTAYGWLGLVAAPAVPVATSIDLAASGFGVARFEPPAVALGALVVALIALMGLAARIGRGGWVVLGAVSLGILALAVGTMTQQPVRGGASTTGLAFDHRESVGIQASTHFDVYAVGDGEPFTFALTIRNPSPLPVQILGLVDTFTEPGPGFVPGLEIVGLGTRSGPVISGSPDGASVFEPVRLEPGEDVQLVVVGRGSTCAAGTEPAESLATVTSLPIAYRILGATRTVDIPLASVVAVPMLAASCMP